MTAEVESLVEDRVDAVLADSHTSPQDRVTLVSKLVEALEQDANWVEMYGITGELNVPGPADQEEGTGELLGKIKKVRVIRNLMSPTDAIVSSCMSIGIQ